MSGDASDFNNIKRSDIKFLFLHGQAPKEIHAILTKTLACFLPGRAKHLSAALYMYVHIYVMVSKVGDSMLS